MTITKDLKQIKEFLQNKGKVLSWIFTLFSLSLVVYILIINKEKIVFITKMNPWAILGVFLSYIIYLVVASHRYLMVLKKFSLGNISWFEWFKIFVIGRFMSKWIPQSGIIYRGIKLKSTCQYSYTIYSSSLLFFQWLDTAMGLAIFLIIILITDQSLRFANMNAIIVLLLSLVLVIFGPIVSHFILSKVKLKGQFITRIHKSLVDVLKTAIHNLQDKKFVIRVLFWGTGGFFLTLAQFYFAFRVLNVHAGFIQLLLYTAILRLLFIYRLTPGNLGLQELAYGFLGQITGSGFGPSVTVSFIIRCTAYSGLGILGALFGGRSIWKGRQRMYIRNSEASPGVIK